MGLLDDAIREHLELKRKHGAAEEELHRKETEALGPARRDFTAAPASEEPADEIAVDDAEPEPEPAVEPAGWLDDEPGAGAFDVVETRPEPVEPVEPVLEPTEPTEPEPTGPEPTEPVPAAHEPPLAEPPPRQEGDTPARGFPAVPREEDVAEDAEEDVLEETPDFLQDTPEHDRLWFEQKPPRDFDFDD